MLSLTTIKTTSADHQPLSFDLAIAAATVDPTALPAQVGWAGLPVVSKNLLTSVTAHFLI
ncbi:hypothetical protein [Glaciimonas sp. PCH181]|uniref:hypothetical protein n=1 Tax=Glaciimonas sp. PCH181 TaxID=2133943 RepID=UPI000D3B1CAF|nr:hypothetical protein [Glaciimonas sp. PCH181]PUA16647.1 hypothetical protein C7W93_21840 [Glaciimonas sp. PCH181]